MTSSSPDSALPDPRAYASATSKDLVRKLLVFVCVGLVTLTYNTRLLCSLCEYLELWLMLRLPNQSCSLRRTGPDLLHVSSGRHPPEQSFVLFHPPTDDFSEYTPGPVPNRRFFAAHFLANCSKITSCAKSRNDNATDCSIPIHKFDTCLFRR